jgi:hypothetical protein
VQALRERADASKKEVRMRHIDACWQLDTGCVLPRGPAGTFDCDVVGDPCIVWDAELGAWRMFYFAMGRGGCSTAWAVSRSAEDIAPGDWDKRGVVALANAGDLVNPANCHKWWVVLEAGRCNRPAIIDGSYWSLVVCQKDGSKAIQAARAERLDGPWHVVPRPILSPGEADAVDGLHCDTPTAYWFADRSTALLFYKAYPRRPQAWSQSPFGSASVCAEWQPARGEADKLGPILSPDAESAWAAGWIGGVQLLGDAERGWYALLNASPAPPADKSNREPAPSLGGWAVCGASRPAGAWRLDDTRSPLLRPSDLTPQQTAAGLGTNFWRHHLLVTDSGQARIFFNSGAYGREQMYSMTA